MPKATICSTRVGLFPNRDAAERAVADLKEAGYRDHQIGMLAKDPEVRAVLADGTETNAAEGATVGAVAGGVVGAGVGAAVLTGMIPVIGPVLALGTLGTILLNAVG